MKLVIASDIHGNIDNTLELIKAFEKEDATCLVLLGDIYNPGPRNPITAGYNPLEVAKALNSIKDRLIVVKGNCDSQVDTLISEFHFVEEVQLFLDGRIITCTHGHIFNDTNIPANVGDCLVYGHFHVGKIERKESLIIANAGSISLPKDNTKKTYLTIDSDSITLKTLKGEEMRKEFFNDTKK